MFFHFHFYSHSAVLYHSIWCFVFCILWYLLSYFLVWGSHPKMQGSFTPGITPGGIWETIWVTGNQTFLATCKAEALTNPYTITPTPLQTNQVPYLFPQAFFLGDAGSIGPYPPMLRPYSCWDLGTEPRSTSCVAGASHAVLFGHTQYCSGQFPGLVLGLLLW